MHESMNIKFIKLFGKLYRRNKMSWYFKGPPPKCKSKTSVSIDEVVDVCHSRYVVDIALMTTNI